MIYHLQPDEREMLRMISRVTDLIVSQVLAGEYDPPCEDSQGNRRTPTHAELQLAPRASATRALAVAYCDHLGLCGHDAADRAREHVTAAERLAQDIILARMGREAEDSQPTRTKT